MDCVNYTKFHAKIFMAKLHCRVDCRAYVIHTFITRHIIRTTTIATATKITVNTRKTHFSGHGAIFMMKISSFFKMPFFRYFR